MPLQAGPNGVHIVNSRRRPGLRRLGDLTALDLGFDQYLRFLIAPCKKLGKVFDITRLKRFQDVVEHSIMDAFGFRALMTE
jgi:hypothetical protein